jgi:ParB family chromosome partitioning protein
LVWEGAISLGHARALLSLGDEALMASMAKEIISDGLSVRDVERRTRERSSAPANRKPNKRSAVGSAETKRIEDLLRTRLQTDARVVVTGGGRGELRIPFYSADDLERLLDLTIGRNRELM